MGKVNYDELKALSQSEITAAMKEGKIEVPQKGDERVKFLEFTATPLEQREEWLKKNAGEQPPAPPASGEPIKPPEQPKPAEAPAPAGASSEPWWHAKGYESEKEAVSAIDKMNEIVTAQKETIDRFNAERGKLGKRLIDIENERDALLKAPPVAPKVEAVTPKPQRPKRPNAKDFDDGVLDAKYHAALEEHEKKVESYEAEHEAYLLSLKPKGFETVEKELGSIKEKVESSYKHFETSAQSAAEEARNRAYDEMWKEAETIQSDYGVRTSVPVRTINQYMLALDARNEKSFTVEQKAEANKFVSTLSPVDRKNFEAVSEMVGAMYDFGTGLPTKRYKTREAAMIDNGLHTKYKKPQPQAPVPPPREEGVSALPASALQSGDTPIGASANKTDTERLKILVDNWSASVKNGTADRFEASPDFAELKRLRRLHGVKDPQTARYKT